MKDDLKCYISPPNNESKLLKRISDYIIEFVCGYATCATFWWCTNTFGRAVYMAANVHSYGFRVNYMASANKYRRPGVGTKVSFRAAVKFGADLEGHKT